MNDLSKIAILAAFGIIGVVALTYNGVATNERIEMAKLAHSCPAPVSPPETACVAWLYGSNLEAAKTRMCGAKR